MYKASFLCTLLFFLGHALYSQVAIGNNGTPSLNKDALLDLSNTSNKGLLLPQVALTSTTAPAPLSAHIKGMFVYNTALAGSGSTAVSPGIYMNDGTQWKAVFTGASNAPPVAQSPAISGTAAIAQVDTASYTYSDADGDLEGGTTFQWYRATDQSGNTDMLIPGATSQTYTFTSADVGKYLRVAITPKARTGASPGITVYTGYSLLVQSDALRAALTTSVAAYDAAAAGNWVEITAPEYGNLAAIAGAAKHGITDAGMVSSYSNFGAGNTVSQTLAGVYNAPPLIPTSNYVFAFAVRAATGGSNNGTIYVSPNPISGYTIVGTSISYSSVSNGANYFVRKRPATATSPLWYSYLSFYSASGYSYIPATGSCFATDQTSTTTWLTAYVPQFQCISTAIKSW